MTKFRQLPTDINKILEFINTPKDHVPEQGTTPEWSRHLFYTDIHKLLVTGQFDKIVEKYEIKLTDELLEIKSRYELKN